MSDFYLDTETFSLVDIKNGLDRYSKAAEVMIWTYASGREGLVRDYDVTTGARMPSELEDNLLDERVTLIAHNAQFDREVIANNGFPTDIDRWHCTMAQALAHSLPGALDKLCAILKVDDDLAKLKDGKALVRLFCMPRPKNMKLRRATRETHPEEWKRFVEYARNDISSMREVHRIMPAWNYGTGSEAARREKDLWHLDQRINQRGVCIDTDLVEGAIISAGRVQAQLAADTFEMTEGALTSTTKRDALLTLLRDVYDVEIENLRGSTIEALLKTEHDLPPVAVELLENRLAASSTSVSKYKRFKQLTGADGRLRNTLQFCGAARTGRWAGRGVQLQNLPRPTLKQKAIDAGIDAIKGDYLDLVDDNPMTTLSSAIRGCVVAPEGRKLVVADLSNIEGRMLAWLAGEEWKLQAFRDFDTCMGTDGQWHTGDELRDAVLAGKPIDLVLDKKGEPTRKGHDLYALAYARAFGITPEEVMENKRTGDGSYRQGGKILELACGYQGSVGAFATFAVAYGTDLDDMALKAAPSIPAAIMEKADRSYAWAIKNRRDYNMVPLTYKVCWSFVRLWRDANPKIEAFWAELEKAFRSAINAPGKMFTAGKVSVIKSGAWVRVLLPSGRSLCYPAPRLDENDKLSYMGLSQLSRQWRRLMTYGGKVVENVTQAAARDVIADAIPTIDRSGYSVCVTVHDEDICEAPDNDRYTSDHLAALMACNPGWAAGLPLAAAGFETGRYRKD